MGLLKEFKDFAMRGNVVDMAVGIVIGAAFGKIVTSLVADVIMPPIGMLMGGVDFSNLSVKIGEQTKNVLKDGKPISETVDLVIRYGAFIQTVVDFVIVAAAIFLVIKLMNTAKARFEKQQEAAPPAGPSAEVKLLTEIRDSLKR